MKKQTRIKGCGEICLMFVTALILIFAVARVVGIEKEQTVDKVQELSNGWYFIENGKKVEVTLPFVAEAEGEEPFVLYNDSLTEEDAGKTLTMKGAQYGLQVSMNGRTLYEYSDSLFHKNVQMKSKIDCDIRIPDTIRDGILTMIYRTTERGRYKISEVYIGSGSAIMSYHFADTLITRSITFLFLILGVIAIGCSIYLNQKEIEVGGIVDVALFLMICSIWVLTDSPFIQRQSGREAMVCVISFYAFMLLAIPMLHFLKKIGNMQKSRMLDWCIRAFYMNAIGQGILNYYQIFDFVDMLFVTHILLTAAVVIATRLLIKEYKENSEKEVKILLIAFVIMAASGVIAVLLYWILEISYYGVIFQFGILIFVLLVLSDIIMNVEKNMHFKTEMLVYQRLSREDWMTGMENRQPFEECMTAIQKTADQFENAALVFMDLNHLKKINDEFGHAVGDKMIIGAAQCINNAFSEGGKCYRIGGDEFCAVLLNPQKKEEEWMKQLDEEIRQFNKDSNYKLSIARGWSYLRKIDGTIKTISDWKYEADSKMYENKGGMKRL